MGGYRPRNNESGQPTTRITPPKRLEDGIFLGPLWLDVVGSGGGADDVGGVARFLVSEVLLQEMQGSHTRLWGGISMGERAWRYGSDDLGPEPEKGRQNVRLSAGQLAGGKTTPKPMNLQ